MCDLGQVERHPDVIILEQMILRRIQHLTTSGGSSSTHSDSPFTALASHLAAFTTIPPILRGPPSPHHRLRPTRLPRGRRRPGLRAHLFPICLFRLEGSRGRAVQLAADPRFTSKLRGMIKSFVDVWGSNEARRSLSPGWWAPYERAFHYSNCMHHCLDDLSWHGPNVRASMPSDFGLVTHLHMVWMLMPMVGVHYLCEGKGTMVRELHTTRGAIGCTGRWTVYTPPSDSR